MEDELELRISDEDRHHVIAHLRRATTEGRIDLDEFAQRVERTYAARTPSELAPVFVDLPLPTPVDDTPVVIPPARAARPRRRRRRVVAVMGGSDRKGRFHLDRRTTAMALMGHVTLDLRGAAIEHGDVDIRCWALLGGVDVIVPEGVPVDFGGFVLMGGRDEKVADVVPHPEAPRLRVRGYGMFGAVDLESRPYRPNERELGDEVRQRLRRGVERLLGASGPVAAVASAADPRPPTGTVTVLAATFDPPPVPVRRRGTLLRRDTGQATAEEAVRRAVLGALRGAGASGVEVTGAGVLAVFPSARTALRAAVAARVGAPPGDVEGSAGLRIGLHAIELDGEGDGDELALGRRTAAALAAGAQSGEVLASDAVATLGASSGLRFGPGRGVPGPSLLPVRAHPLLGD